VIKTSETKRGCSFFSFWQQVEQMAVEQTAAGWFQAEKQEGENLFLMVNSSEHWLHLE
jgi:hypothetical protein